MALKIIPKNRRTKSARVKRVERSLRAFVDHVEQRLELRPGDLLKPEQDQNHLLKPSQATDYLGVSAKTLANWRYQGSGPKFRKIGSRVFYRRSDLMRFRKARRYKNTSQYCSGPRNEELGQ